jgi:hypothetical protein
MMGMALSPVDPYVVANIISFGAGCLMFAVTVELYGEQLKHLHEHNHEEGVLEVILCLFAALLGAILYLMLNRWVESLEHQPEPHTETVIAKAIEGSEPVIAPKAAPEPAKKEAQVSTTTPPDSGRTPPDSARKKWKSVRHVFKSRKFLMDTQKLRLKYGMPSDGSTGAQGLALGMLAGIIADGVPESILIGFLASSGKLSLMFVASLFIANFPESFSSASLMKQHNTFTSFQIMALWTFPCVMTGTLAALACFLVPAHTHGWFIVKISGALIEGLAGGMMLAMIASVMLPQAYNMAKEAVNPFDKLVTGDPAKQLHHGGDVPGVLCVCGFLTAVGLKVLGGFMGAAH